MTADHGPEWERIGNLIDELRQRLTEIAASGEDPLLELEAIADQRNQAALYLQDAVDLLTEVQRRFLSDDITGVLAGRVRKLLDDAVPLLESIS